MENNKDSTTTTPNIVIFGETGAGKSSLINLIAGQPLAPTSSRAVGCTFEHKPYKATVDGVDCCFWDTTGLDEGTEGTVPADKAENHLKELIQGLARTGGINLVVYCFRAARFRKALRRNYDTFYSGICRKKVPIALVITGLEHQENGMETWWDTEEEVLHRCGLRFDAHACVTTLDSQDEVVQERRLDSQRRLRGLFLTYSQRTPWRIGEPFISQMFPVFRGLIRTTSSPDREPIRTVIVHDMTSSDPIECSPGVAISWHTYACTIGRHQYEFIRTDARIQDQSTNLQGVGGLLIFYTSPLVDATISQKDSDALKEFYDKAGGLTCPMIVVLRGCYDESGAQACLEVASSSLGIQAHPAFLPNAADDRSSGQTELMTMVERLWINPLLVKSKPRTSGGGK